MTKTSKLASAIGGSADDTEATFYEALQTGDLERLMGCWADDDEVICIHPSGPRLVGLGAIRSAFEAMLGNGSLRVQAQAVRKVVSMGSAVHSVRERIEVLTNEGLVEAFALATNVYHKTAQGWRMVAHHASPGMEDEIQEINLATQVFH